MKFTTYSVAKVLLATALSASLFNLSAMATCATTNTITSSGDVLSTVNGGYGAHVNSITNGATITTDLTHANVNIYGNGSTLTWQSLNTAPSQSLNFNFSANGQVALNNVVGGSMSKFAGSLTSSGAAGRVVVSNPNGILFENGSYTNVNALILTTKDVMWDGNLNGQINLMMNKSTAGITIGQGDTSKMAVMRIAEDLNIVAPKIAINAADIKTGVDANGNLLHNCKGDLRLITADGVTFYAANAVKPCGDKFAYTGASNDRNYGDITIQKASIAVADNTTGKVYLIAKRDANLKDGSVLRNAIVNAGNCLNIADSTITNSTLTTLTSKMIIINSTIGYSTLLSNYIISMAGSTVTNSTLKSVKLLDVTNTTINGSTLISTQDKVNLYTNIKLTNSIVNAASDFVLSEAIADKCTVTSLNTKIYHNSRITNSTIDASANIKLTESYLGKSKLQAGGNIGLYTSVVENSSLSSNSALLEVGSLLKNSSFTTKKDFNLNASTVNNSTVLASNNINILNKSILNYTYDQAGHNINLDNSTINNSTVLSNNDINILNKSNIKYTYDQAGHNVNLNNSTVNNSTIYAANVVNQVKTTVNKSSITSGHTFGHMK